MAQISLENLKHLNCFHQLKFEIDTFKFIYLNKINNLNLVLLKIFTLISSFGLQTFKISCGYYLANIIIFEFIMDSKYVCYYYISQIN